MCLSRNNVHITLDNLKNSLLTVVIRTTFSEDIVNLIVYLCPLFGVEAEIYTVYLEPVQIKPKSREKMYFLSCIVMFL